MESYREVWTAAIAQLGESYGTPAYIAAKESFFMLFEKFAAADIRLIEDFFPEPDDPDYPVNEEVLADLSREVEILRRVNYSRADRWEQGYLRCKALLATDVR